MGANWDGSLGIGLASDAAAVSPSSAKPDWLKQPAVPASVPIVEESAPIDKEQDQIPEFLREAGWGESSGTFQESESAIASEAEVAPAVQADLPDWIKAMAPAEAETPPASPVAATPSAVDVPDWLQNLDKSQSATPISPSAPPAAPVPPAMDVPDWLQNLDKSQSSASVSPPQAPINQPMPAPVPQSQAVVTPPKPAPVIQSQKPAAPKPVLNQPAATNAEPVASAGADPLGGLGKSAQEQDDAMAWLESLAAKHGAKAEELVTDPNARTDIAPDWVDKAKIISEPSAAAPAPAIEKSPLASDDQTGMWLRHLEDSDAETFVAKKEKQEPSSAAEPPDWMRGLSDQDSFSQITNEPADAEEDTPILGVQETPDWLKDMQKEPAQPASQNVPDWLRGIEQPDQPVAHPPAPSEVPDSASPVDLPAWLAGLDKEEETTTPSVAPSDEFPTWLTSEDEAKPQVAEPTQPEEWHPVEPEPHAVEFDSNSRLVRSGWAVCASQSSDVRNKFRS